MVNVNATIGLLFIRMCRSCTQYIESKFTALIRVHKSFLDFISKISKHEILCRVKKITTIITFHTYNNYFDRFYFSKYHLVFAIIVIQINDQIKSMVYLLLTHLK